MKSRSIVGAFALALVLVLVSSAPATAQTLTAFNIERQIALNNILTTITPNIPANVLAALAGGALEVREVAVFNPQAATATSQGSLTSTVFVVPTGSPIPTPAAALANLGSALVQSSTMTVDKIYVTAKPFMSVTFVGTVTQSTATPYGNYLGATATLSVGFTSDTPPKINTVIETVSGALVAYSAAATVNTFTVTLPPTPPGGGGGAAPTVKILVNGGPSPVTVLVKEVSLDASQSTDPNGLALTYQWVSVPGSPTASVLHSTSAVATAQLQGNGPNVYTFMVTVTNSAGQSATATATVNFVGH